MRGRAQTPAGVTTETVEMLPELEPDRLLEQNELALSVSVSFDLAQRDQRAHHGHLRSLLTEARSLLQARGLEPRLERALLDKAEKAAGQLEFREHRVPGLALFVTPQATHLQPLPAPVQEAVVLGPRFNLKPLLPVLDSGPPFHLLALTARRARLWHCDRYVWHEIALELPPGVSEVAEETTFDPTVQYNPVARVDEAMALADGVVKSHRYETAEEQRKIQLVEYVQRVARSIVQHQARQAVPLLLAADPELAGHFRKHSRLQTLLPETLELNPDGMTEAELHARAAALLQPAAASEIVRFLEQVRARQGIGGPTVSAGPEEVALAAHDGRVDAAAVAVDAVFWGSFDPATRRVETREKPTGLDEDLLNFIAVTTLAKGGRVFALPREKLPSGSLAVALDRF